LQHIAPAKDRRRRFQTVRAKETRSRVLRKYVLFVQSQRSRLSNPRGKREEMESEIHAETEIQRDGVKKVASSVDSSMIKKTSAMIRRRRSKVIHVASFSNVDHCRTMTPRQKSIAHHEMVNIWIIFPEASDACLERLPRRRARPGPSGWVWHAV